MAESGISIGYARVSTAARDLTAQRDSFADLGVEADRVYVDHGPPPVRAQLAVTVAELLDSVEFSGSSEQIIACVADLGAAEALAELLRAMHYTG